MLTAPRPRVKQKYAPPAGGWASRRHGARKPSHASCRPRPYTVACPGSRAVTVSLGSGATMLTRRTFVGGVGAGLLAASMDAAEPTARKKMAIITTEWRYMSHAWHMGERFLVGYPIRGQWHR